MIYLPLSVLSLTLKKIRYFLYLIKKFGHIMGWVGQTESWKFQIFFFLIPSLIQGYIYRMALNIVEGYVIDTSKPWCAPFARFVEFFLFINCIAMTWLVCWNAKTKVDRVNRENFFIRPYKPRIYMMGTKKLFFVLGVNRILQIKCEKSRNLELGEQETFCWKELSWNR